MLVELIFSTQFTTKPLQIEICENTSKAFKKMNSDRMTMRDASGSMHIYAWLKHALEEECHS